MRGAFYFFIALGLAVIAGGGGALWSGRPHALEGRELLQAMQRQTDWALCRTIGGERTATNHCRDVDPHGPEPSLDAPADRGLLLAGAIALLAGAVLCAVGAVLRPRL